MTAKLTFLDKEKIENYFQQNQQIQSQIDLKTQKAVAQAFGGKTIQQRTLRRLLQNTLQAQQTRPLDLIIPSLEELLLQNALKNCTQ